MDNEKLWVFFMYTLLIKTFSSYLIVFQNIN
jgi:hypothetical protein